MSYDNAGLMSERELRVANMIRRRANEIGLSYLSVSLGPNVTTSPKSDTELVDEALDCVVRSIAAMELGLCTPYVDPCFPDYKLGIADTVDS